jgi:hypothetical protein
MTGITTGCATRGALKSNIQPRGIKPSFIAHTFIMNEKYWEGLIKQPRNYYAISCQKERSTTISDTRAAYDYIDNPLN